jgi:subtilisin family serine protease
MHLLVNMKKKYGIPDLINLSIGIPRFCNGKDALARMVNLASDRGILVITSAGNYGNGGPLACPGCAEGSVTVGGAVKAWRNGKSFPSIYDRSSWSQIPGKPDLLAPSCVPVRTRMFFKLTPDGPELSLDEPMLGTSFAAPFVSGVAALIMQRLKISDEDPMSYPSIVRSRLIASASKIPDIPIQAQGAGFLDVSKALAMR